MGYLLVPITKEDESMRICLVFKITLNPVLDVDKYPLPKIEEIFASSAGVQQFTKLDLKNACLQMTVRKEEKRG